MRIFLTLLLTIVLLAGCSHQTPKSYVKWNQIPKSSQQAVLKHLKATLKPQWLPNKPQSQMYGERIPNRDLVHAHFVTDKHKVSILELPGHMWISIHNVDVSGYKPRFKSKEDMAAYWLNQVIYVPKNAIYKEQNRREEHMPIADYVVKLPEHTYAFIIIYRDSVNVSFFENQGMKAPVVNDPSIIRW